MNLASWKPQAVQPSDCVDFLHFFPFVPEDQTCLCQAEGRNGTSETRATVGERQPETCGLLYARTDSWVVGTGCAWGGLCVCVCVNMCMMLVCVYTRECVCMCACVDIHACVNMCVCEHVSVHGGQSQSRGRPC